MIYLAYIVFFISIVQLFVVVINLFFYQKLPAYSNNTNELVSIMIPARNEEHNISNILQDLLHQEYKNIEILVFDDQSTDKTASVVWDFTKTDSRIKLIESSGLPAGWLGKNFACHSLAKLANGEYLLFLDSDVRIGNDIIRRSIAFSKKHKLGLLSIFPKQIIQTSGEWLTVPVMNYILLSLLPLFLVRKSRYSSLAAANGQYMLFDSKMYRELLPHKQFKSHKVEDIEIARHFKLNSIKIACITGNESIQCRMYTNFSEAVNGFSKNTLHFFGNSVVAAVLFWLITTFGFLPIVFKMSVPVVLFYFLIIITIRIIISLISHQNILKNIVYHFPQQLVLGLFITKSILNKHKRNYEWKGRSII